MRIDDTVKRQLLLFVVFLGLSFYPLAQDIEPVPELERRVTDLTGTLSSGEVDAIESKLEALEKEKGSQVAVLIVPTTGDETVEQYAIRVAHDVWKLGREGVDDGVLFLVAMKDRKMRIEVGYGLEGAITDALSKRIITNVVTPEFRSGHYYSGIDKGVDVIIGAIRGEELPPAVAANRQSGSGGTGSWMLPLLIFGFFGSAILKALLKGKLGNAKATAVVTAIIFVLGWIFVGLLAGLFVGGLVALFTGMPVGGRGGRGGGYWGGYGGYGRGGGGYSGGGGFGGFSGGGGGFGGGGASGGW